MNAFTSRRIVKSKKLGEKLAEARAERGFGLERAAKDLNIAFKYLEALERGDWAALPGSAYGRSFLKKYCEYLRLDFGECWKEAEVNFNSAIKSGLSRADKRFFLSWPRFRRRVLVIIVICAAALFFAFRIWLIFSPPELVIIEPADGTIVLENRVMVAGRSEKEAEVAVNSQNIFVGEGGEFSAEIDLQKGLNLIKITAKKKYGRTRAVEIRVLFKENEEN